MKISKLLLALLLVASSFSCKKAQENLSESEKIGSVTKNAVSKTLASITVAKDGSGNYTTVQAALNAVPNYNANRTVINVKNGTYKEVVTVESSKKNVSLIGESATGVKLTYDNYSSKINPATGTGYGTSGSASTFIKAEGFYAQNIVFENSSGPVGQALAINISGDKSVFNNCRFLGRQDTWYAGQVRSYLKNCYLEGSKDFIFGPATAYFDGCTIYSHGGSAITAANTASYVTYGFVFNNCTVTGASGVVTDFGRTWGAYAATAFVNSSISSVISSAGWSNWGNTANNATARYSEYGNTGTGANRSGRVSWSKLLTSAEAANYTDFKNVLKTTYASTPVTDNWDPSIVISDPAASIPSQTIVSGAVYSIISQNAPGKGLDVTNVSTTNGAYIQLYNYIGSSNQRFIINDIGGGFYNIVNVNSGKCVDVKDYSTSNGGLIHQYTYNNTTNQHWLIEDVGNGYFRIINRNSGKCLDVKDYSTSNNAVIHQWTYVGTANQHWQLNKLN